jgi:hypothetical protein
VFEITGIPGHLIIHMDELNDFVVSSSPLAFLDYNEELEEEYITRTRSVFDDFVSPKTGAFVTCTFADIFNGLDRLWSLAQEMKSQIGNIHERLVTLPLLFMVVLFRKLEQEYTAEIFEKVAHDSVLSGAFMKLFTDLNKKAVHFEYPRANKIVFSVCLIYARHIIDVLDADRHIKRIKWKELRVRRCVISSPVRDEDKSVILEALRYFKENVLPSYSKQSVMLNLSIKPKYPEIMEPTYEFQCDVADFLNIFSLIMLLSSMVFGGLIFAIDDSYRYKEIK